MKIGRPKKPKEERKVERLAFRLTTKEKDFVKERARNHQHSLSNFIRLCVLNGTIY